MRIYTITLNPAYDAHAFAEHFEPFHENLAQMQSREAGGKGVNISRALISAGVFNTAVILLGRDNASDFKEELADSGIELMLFEKPGRIRENLTLHTVGAPETRISFDGFRVSDSALDEIANELAVDDDTVITMTGRVATGMSMEKVKVFLKALQAKGARIVVDSRSFQCEDIFQVAPWLIKPNQEEISQYLGKQVDTIPQAVEAARIFAEKGVENVMVSMGAQGAILISGGRIWAATTPQIKICSTIGAGDSSVAGFVAAAAQGESVELCLKRAMAFGTAACLTEGTKPPAKEDILRIYEQITVEEVTARYANPAEA